MNFYWIPCSSHGQSWSSCFDWRIVKNIDAAAYEKNINQDVKLPSTKKQIDRNDKTEYWPTSIKESLDWLLFWYHGVHCRQEREW